MLAIDIGNTAIKLGIWAGDQLTHRNTVIYQEEGFRGLLDTCFASLPQQSKVVICSVANENINNAVRDWFNRKWGAEPKFAKTQAKQMGVKNAYGDYRQMGVDRWVAIIGAFKRYKQGLCVIDCGTAITLDVVRKDGCHQGGLIMPGLKMMQQSLLQNTSGIEEVQGELTNLAKDTGSAVKSGCLQLITSGLSQIINHYASQHDELICVTTGGDAEKLIPYINSDCVLDKDLILYGLKIISNQ